jgi:hypothetical protein
VTDSGRAESAGAWLGTVQDWIYDKTHAVGIDAWNTDPALRETRNRALRLAALARARSGRAAASGRDRARARS